MGSIERQPYTGIERRTLPRPSVSSGIVAYARFLDLPGALHRYPGHDRGRWYEVRERNEEAEDPVALPDYVWLDMGIIRGVRREDLEIRASSP